MENLYNAQFFNAWIMNIYMITLCGWLVYGKCIYHNSHELYIFPKRTTISYYTGYKHTQVFSSTVKRGTQQQHTAHSSSLPSRSDLLSSSSIKKKVEPGFDLADMVKFCWRNAHLSCRLWFCVEFVTPTHSNTLIRHVISTSGKHNLELILIAFLGLGWVRGWEGL